MVMLVMLSSVTAFGYEETKVKMIVNGDSVNFRFSPVIRDGVTYVDVKTLAGKLGLNYKTFSNHDSIILSNSRKSMCIVPGDVLATVADMSGRNDSEFFHKILTAAPIYINGHLAVAARDISTVFGYTLTFNKDENTVYFGFDPKMISAATRENIESRAYYFQNQAEFNLPSYGSGYCWATCYAMVITNITGERITPLDVADVNLTMSSDGAYCYHDVIASAFNVEFTSALSTDSPYYGGRVSGSGGTYIENPEHDDNVVRAALKEALTLHPGGVMVRYADFPHTIVAVAYEGDTILFNDPAASTYHSYSDTGKYQGVPFSETCVGRKGYSLSDVTFIQAITR